MVAQALHTERTLLQLKALNSKFEDIADFLTLKRYPGRESGKKRGSERTPRPEAAPFERLRPATARALGAVPRRAVA